MILNLVFTPPSCTAIEKIIGRYRIPAGTPTIIDVHRLNRNPLTWGADGNQFRPERFKEIGEIQRKYGFVKFGVGDEEGYLTRNMLETLLRCVAVGAAEIYETSSKN